MRYLFLALLATLPLWASLELAVPSVRLGAPLHAEIHLPADYDQHPGRRYPVCLLLHGGGGRARELRELGLASLATRFQVVFAVPDAGPVLFVDAPGAGPQLASALVKDLLPAVDRRFRTQPAPTGRWVVGLSLGGYAALRLGLGHPRAFGQVASLSGVVEVACWSAAEEAFLPRPQREQIDRSLGAPGTPERLAQDLAALAEHLPLPVRRTLPALHLECGAQDTFFLAANRRLARHMEELGLQPALVLSPGGHDSVFWTRRLEALLSAWSDASNLQP